MRAYRRSLFFILCLSLLVSTGCGSAATGISVWETGPEADLSSQFADGSGEAWPGYTLVAPIQSTTTYLIDMDGKVVHQWESLYHPGNSAYLLEDGRLLRAIQCRPKDDGAFDAGGAGGGVEILDWDGAVLWHYELPETWRLSHHDVEYMPNGNVLIIAWEKKSREEALQAGRRPDLLSDGELWPDSVLEVRPEGANGGEIVWEWHIWDHLVQDYDAGKANYGSVSEHPELIDINYLGHYLERDQGADWTHCNNVDYNDALNQVMISVRCFNEVWIIDHSTTSLEAAGHSGGKYEQGGDILYRWGNPQAYKCGNGADQQLFGQHDAGWIDAGLPGEGHILVFNNGAMRPPGGVSYSTVDEIEPSMTEDGHYQMTDQGTFYPDSAMEVYKADPPRDMFAPGISGCQRLPNGNTLICNGPRGLIFEVDSDMKVVWKYQNPYPEPGSRGAKDPHSVFLARRYGLDYPGLARLQ